MGNDELKALLIVGALIGGFVLRRVAKKLEKGYKRTVLFFTGTLIITWPLASLVGIIYNPERIWNPLLLDIPFVINWVVLTTLFSISEIGSFKEKMTYDKSPKWGPKAFNIFSVIVIIGLISWVLLSILFN